MAAWKKIYVRDKLGVMRALPGIKITRAGTLWIAESVYTMSSPDSGMMSDWWLALLKDESEWGYGQ